LPFARDATADYFGKVADWEYENVTTVSNVPSKNVRDEKLLLLKMAGKFVLLEETPRGDVK
jgi:hypothetical protein